MGGAGSSGAERRPHRYNMQPNSSSSSNDLMAAAVTGSVVDATTGQYITNSHNTLLLSSLFCPFVYLSKKPYIFAGSGFL